MLMAESRKLKQERKIDEVKIAKVLAMPGLTGQEAGRLFRQGRMLFCRGRPRRHHGQLEHCLGCGPRQRQCGRDQAVDQAIEDLADAQEEIVKLKPGLEKAKGLDRAKLLDQLIDAASKLNEGGMKTYSEKESGSAREIIALDPRTRQG